MDINSIDSVDERDFMPNSELEEYYYEMDTVYGISDDPDDYLSDYTFEELEEYYEMQAEGFDPDDRYGDMRIEPVTFHRIAGNTYRS